MARIESCLSHIQAVRTVAAGVEPAYVARSRIGRLTLSTAALVAREVGIPRPDFPRPLPVPMNGPRYLVEVTGSCNRLVSISRHLAQPSEPLDERWRRGWSELLAELATLEAHLVALRETDSGS